MENHTPGGFPQFQKSISGIILCEKSTVNDKCLVFNSLATHLIRKTGGKPVISTYLSKFANCCKENQLAHSEPCGKRDPPDSASRSSQRSASRSYDVCRRTLFRSPGSYAALVSCRDTSRPGEVERLHASCSLPSVHRPTSCIGQQRPGRSYQALIRRDARYR